MAVGCDNPAVVAGVGGDHPLTHDAITPARYAECRHISVSRRGRRSGPIDEALGALGLKWRVTAIVSGFTAALELARTSDLVANVPAGQTEGRHAGMQSFPLPVATLELTIAQLWNPRLDGDQAHRWLRRCVREICHWAPP